MITLSRLYLTQQFETLFTKKGSKNISKKNLKSFFINGRKKGLDPLFVLENSIGNIEPSFSITTRKKGKRVIQVPKPIFSKQKRVSVGLKSIFKNSGKYSEKTFQQAVYQEIINAFDNKGFSKKQQQDLYKLVLLNRASLQFNR